MKEPSVTRVKILRIGKNQNATHLSVRQLEFAQKTYYRPKHSKESQMSESTKEYYQKQIKMLELKVTELQMALDDAHAKLMVAK